MGTSGHLRLELINKSSDWKCVIVTEFARHRPVTNNKYIYKVETVFAEYFFPVSEKLALNWRNLLKEVLGRTLYLFWRLAQLQSVLFWKRQQVSPLYQRGCTQAFPLQEMCLCWLLEGLLADITEVRHREMQRAERREWEQPKSSAVLLIFQFCKITRILEGRGFFLFSFLAI